MRHVHGSALVAHVDDANAATAEVIPDRLDVTALQPVDAVDAARHEKLRDPLCNRTGDCGRRAHDPPPVCAEIRQSPQIEGFARKGGGRERGLSIRAERSRQAWHEVVRSPDYCRVDRYSI